MHQYDDRMKTSELKFRSYMKMNQNWKPLNATQGHISSHQYVPNQMDQFDISSYDLSKQHTAIDKRNYNTNDKYDKQGLIDMISK